MTSVASRTGQSGRSSAAWPATMVCRPPRPQAGVRDLHRPA